MSVSLSKNISEKKFFNLGYIFFILSFVKIFSLIKDVIVARQIGPSVDLDQYFLVLSILNFPVGIYASFCALLITPLFIKDFVNFKKDVLVSEWLGFTLIIGISLMLCLGLLISCLNLGNNGWSFSYFLFLAYPLLMIVVLISNLLNVNEKHNVLWLETFSPLTISLFLFITPTVNSLVLGTLVGYLLHALASVFLFNKRSLLKVKISFNSKKWKEIGSRAFIVLLVLFVTDLLKVLDLFILSNYGNGTVSNYSFSDKVVGVIQSVTVLALGRFLIPKFARLDDSSCQFDILNILIKRIVLVFLIISLLSISLQFISEYFLEMLYRGENISQKDTSNVIGYFNWSSWQFPFYVTSAIMVYFFSSQMQYNVLLKQISIAVVFKGIFLFYSYRYLSSNSVPASNILLYLVMGGYLFKVLLQKRNRLKYDNQ